MKKKIMLIIILVAMILMGFIGITNTDTVKKIIHRTTSQPEGAPFRHM